MAAITEDASSTESSPLLNLTPSQQTSPPEEVGVVIIERGVVMRGRISVFYDVISFQCCHLLISSLPAASDLQSTCRTNNSVPQSRQDPSMEETDLCRGSHAVCHVQYCLRILFQHLSAGSCYCEFNCVCLFGG